jgi:nucleoside-diphosphate-sugar epimerase
MRAAGGEGQGKRALITGAGGFTGRYLARELGAAGYQVFGTVSKGESGGAGMFGVDLCEGAAVTALVAQVRPDVVVHLAAIAFVAHADPGQVYRVNIVGARNLLEALASQRRPPGSVLLASSANVYGNAASAGNDGHGAIDELVAPAPANDYAVSKLAMEYMAQLWTDRLPISILRPFNYTGAGQDARYLLPKIVAHFRSGERQIELGNLDIERDFSDVRIVVRCYRRLLAARAAGQVVNICSGQSHSLAQVLAMMAGIAGYQIEVRAHPALVRTREVLRLVGSNARLGRIIGAPEPFALADTLRWMYEA